MLHSSSADYASPADRAACREAIRHGSRTFYAASLLLPSWLRDPAYGLYAFCRLSDDAVDVDGGAANTLSVLQARLDRVYHGRPDPVPAERALADIVRRYAIPQALPEALLEGLAWDVNGRRYETLDDLHAYAARVAGTVGVMMSLLMGARAPAILARACDLGLAMQLTNIARDVGEDARAGRIYLPLQWLAEEGVEPDAWLSRPVITPALRRVIARLLAAADELYRRSEAGIPSLPLSCRPGMFAARYMYAEIGREVERQDLELGLKQSQSILQPQGRPARPLPRIVSGHLRRPGRRARPRRGLPDRCRFRPPRACRRRHSAARSCPLGRESRPCPRSLREA